MKNMKYLILKFLIKNFQNCYHITTHYFQCAYIFKNVLEVVTKHQPIFAIVLM